jgi:hypothetical protein
VEQEGTKSLLLGAEDYLQGVIGMVNELVCYAEPLHLELLDIKESELIYEDF